MTGDEFKKLAVGDIVKSDFSDIDYVVIANYGDRMTAVRVADITNPDEWSLVRRVTGEFYPSQPTNEKGD